MRVPSKADTKAKLNPYHTKIRSFIDDAWGEWRTVQRFREEKGFSPVLYSRTISNYMFDAIARRAIPALGAEAKVMLQVETQTFKAYINGVLVRVKKGGEDHLGCTWPTQTALAFEELDGQLPGFPAETPKVEIIWLPNDILTQVEQVLVVARDGDKLLWQYEIPPNAGAGSGIVTPLLPKAPDPTPAGDGVNLIKPKTSKIKTEPKS